MDAQTAEQLRTDLAKFLCETVAGDTWDPEDAFHPLKAKHYLGNAEDVIAMVSEAQRPARSSAA